MSPPYLHQDDNLLGPEMGHQLTEEIKQIDYMGAAMSDQPYPTLPKIIQKIQVQN